MKNKKGIIICMIMISILLLGGCGTKISHKSPEAVVKSLISAYQNQDEEAVKKAFGVNPDKKYAKEIQKEIDYNMDYFKAHEADKVEFRKAKSLGKFDKYELVYVWYDYKVKKQKETLEVPAMSFYYVKQKDKKYYVVPAKDVNEKMSENSRKEYSEFMKGDVYQEYDKAYQTFIRKNPKYENSLQNKFEEITK